MLTDESTKRMHGDDITNNTDPTRLWWNSADMEEVATNMASVANINNTADLLGLKFNI